MSADDSLKAKAGPLVFWLGVVIFLASLCAGVFRSLVRDHTIPGVGVEYISELRTAFQTEGYQQTLPWMQAAVQIDLDNDTTARESKTRPPYSSWLETSSFCSRAAWSRKSLAISGRSCSTFARMSSMPTASPIAV